MASKRNRAEIELALKDLITKEYKKVAKNFRKQTGTIRKSMREARDASAAAFATTKKGFQAAAKGSQQFSKGVVNATKKVVNLKNAIAGFAAIQIFKSTIGNLAQVGDSIDKVSAKLGVNAQSLQELRSAAEESGVAVNTFDMGLQRFTRRTAEAAEGTGEAKMALEQLGFSMEDLRNKTPEQLFMQAADALSEVESESRQVRLAFKLFDSEGVSLINMLKGGNAELEEMRERFRESGAVMDDQAIRATVEYTDAMKRMNDVIRGLQVKFFIPIIKDLAATMEGFIEGGGIEKLETGIRGVIAAGKIFLATFAASKFLALSSGFLTAASGARTLGAAMKLLSLNPLLLAVTGLTTAFVLLDEAQKRAAREGMEKFNKLSLDQKERVVELREEWSRLNRETLNGGDAQTIINEAYLRGSATLDTQSAQMQKSKERMKALADEFKNTTGITITSSEALAFNTKAMKENLEESQRLAEEKKKQGSTGGFAATQQEEQAAIQARKQFEAEIEAVRIASLQRSFEGRIDLINEQEQALLANKRISEEQKLLVEQEFNQRRLDENKAFFDALIAEEEKKAQKQMEFDKKIAEQNKRNLDVQLQGRKDLTDAIISSSAEGLQAATRSEKEAQKIAMAASIIQGALAVQRALAQPPGPPFTIPSAIATGLLAATNTATIAGQAFAQGGIVQGPTTGDQVPIRANGGEMVLTQRDQRDLLGMIRSGSGSAGGVTEVNFGEIVINAPGGDVDAIREAVISTNEQRVQQFADTGRERDALLVTG